VVVCGSSASVGTAGGMLYQRDAGARASDAGGAASDTIAVLLVRRGKDGGCLQPKCLRA
jgi:hypothetical protein